MKNIHVGSYQMQPAGYKAFIPGSFPPAGLTQTPSFLFKKTNEATRLLGKLDGVTLLLPNADFFLLMYLKKDAASSSQIEGTIATMVNAIEAEINPNANLPQDVDDILHYIKALNYGIKRVKTENFPVSLRLIKELHYQLLHQARSSHYANPGEFRTTQNWVGGTKPDNAKFVPPPVPFMFNALADLESFIHADDVFPTIIKAGLIHAQFETIHPFLDGNGRTGRMLITIYLWQKGLIEKPVLFLSSYFKKHQQVYYEKLEGYHQGKVNEWLEFFLDGVIEIATEAILIAEKITQLREQDMSKIQSLGKRSAKVGMSILPRLFAQPIVNVQTIAEWTGYTYDGAYKVIQRLLDLGILNEKDPDIKYGQVYVYKNYLDIFA